MKQAENHDQAIETVLSGLREVDPPIGMQQRILRSVQQREAMPRTTWRPMWLAVPGRGRSLAYGLALAGVVTMGVAGLAMRRQPPTPVVAGAPVKLPAASALPSVSMTAADSGRISAPPAHSAMRLTSGPHARRRNDGGSDEDALARSEMLAASHPAPPMPLTEQERLLLRIAHTGDPQELAALSPELRERALRQGDAEFRDFFPPQVVHQ